VDFGRNHSLAAGKEKLAFIRIIVYLLNQVYYKSLECTEVYKLMIQFVVLTN